MVVALVARLAGRVERDVGHHPALHELLAGEVPNELGPSIWAELVRERDAHLPGHAAVHAGLGRLDPVPELGSVMDPIRRVVRGEDLRVLDATAPGVIEGDPGPGVDDPHRGSVGRGRRGAAALAAGYRGSAEVVDRHSVPHLA